ncbi:hypothetical protein [Candidatus Nitrososphaera sp. FF02]|uniref:hypothetical protein n=1 Tax=Candidatus Nitrososphaera sp. FF02 TaxID=3398226 RepID=UPI0039EB9C83
MKWPSGRYPSLTPAELEDLILLALSVRQEATSGEITKYIHSEIRRQENEKYEEGLFERNEFLRRINSRSPTQRTIQKWLPRLEEKGLIRKNKYNVYSLVVDDIGELLFKLYGTYRIKELFKLDANLSIENKLREFMSRMGFLILSDFISASAAIPEYSNEENERKAIESAKDAIPLDLAFDEFAKNFNSTPADPKLIHILQEEDTEHLRRALEKLYPEYAKARDKGSEIAFNKFCNNEEK